MIAKGRFIILFFLVVFSSVGYGQDFCPQVSGQGNFVPISESCLPSARKVWRVEFSFNDAVLGDAQWDEDDISFRINWGDGSAVKNFFLTSGFPEILSFTTDNSIPGVFTFILLVEHFYTTDNVDCFYEATAQLRAPGICIGIIERREFEVWGTDEENGAALQMTPSVANGEVCVGTDFSITFDDTSTWNCIDPTLSIPNDKTRWVRFVYGDAGTGNANRIPNVFVGGVQVTNADGSFTLGTPFTGPVVEITGPGLTGPTETSEIISMTTADEVVGDQFRVYLQNWNECNQYDDGLGGPPPVNGDNPAIQTSELITIIGPVDPTTAGNEYCEGDPRTALSVTNYPGAPTNVNWYTAPTGGAPIGTGITFTPPTAGTFYAQFEDGCISKNRTAATLVEHPLPNDVSVVVNRPNICYNDNVVISILGSQNGIEYQLRNDAGNVPIGGPVTGTGFNRTMFSGPLTTTTTFNILATDPSSALNCDLELSDLVTVNVNPDLSITATVADATVCIGEDIVLSSTPVGGSGSYSYLWSGPNGFSSTAEDPTISSATGAADGVYTVTVTDTGFSPTVGSCTDVSNNVNVTMLTPPSNADLSGDATICQGDNTDLNVSITAGTAPYDVTIDNGVGTFSWSNVGDDPSVSPASTTTYTITNVVDANGCTVSAITGSATITIGNPTDADLDGDASICLGDNTDLTVVITGGNPPYDLNITNIGAVNNYTSGNPINTGALFATTTFTLTSVVDDDGCPVLGISDDEATVIVGQPIAGATLNVNDFCEDENLIFSVTINGGAPLYTINYEVDGVPAVENNYTSGDDIDLGLQAPATYTIEIISVIDNCAVVANNPDVPKNSVISPLPTANDQAPIVCSDASGGNTATVDLTTLEVAIDGGAGNTINWFENNGPLSNPIGTPASYTVTDAVAIFAQVDDGTCTDVATVTYTVDPRPNTPSNPIDNIACSTDVNGAALSVDDPGAGFTVRWYTAFTSPSVNTPVVGGDGVISGTNDEVFTPNSTATATFFAAIETDATGCLSPTAVTLNHTEDPDQSNAIADDGTTSLSVCDDNVQLSADWPAVPSGSGYWLQGLVAYYENFDSPTDQSLGATGAIPVGTNSGVTGPSSYNWSIDVSQGEIKDGNDWFRVENDLFEARDTDDNAGGQEVIWDSREFDVSTFNSVDISVDISQLNGDGSEDLTIEYELNGSGTFNNITSVSGAFAAQTVTQTAVDVSAAVTMKIRIRVETTGGADRVRFDNVIVADNSLGLNIPLITDINLENTTITNLPIGATDFTWIVVSDFNVCNPKTDVVTITRNALPDALDSNPEICEDLPQGSNQATIPDLVLYNDDVTGIVGSVDRTIEYFDDPGRTPADLISPTTNFVVTTGSNIVYTRVTRTDVLPNCTEDGTLTFTINTLPDAVDQDAITNPTEAEFCEETVGSADKDNIDLTLLDDDVAGGIVADRSVEWFFDPGVGVSTRADLTGNEVATPTDVDNVINGQTFYAIIVNNLTLCEDIAQVDITVNPRPINNPIIAPDGSTPASVTVCRSNNVLFFQVDPALNPGTTYTWTVPNAPGELELVGGGGVNDFFVLVRAPNTIASPGVTLSVVETSADNCDGNTNSIDIIVDDAPPAPTINGDQEVCENQSNVTYSIASPIVGSTYTWNIGSLGSIVSGQGTSSIIVNIGTTSDNITVTETSSAGCTSPAAAPYPVTVNPRPNMTSATTATLCSGEQVDTYLTFTSDVGSTTYDWVVLSKTGSVGGATVGNTGSGNITQTLTNTSGAPGSVTYEVTPTGPAPANCVGATQVVTISVNTEPVGVNAISNECSDVALNYDLQNNITVSGNNVASDFTWVAAANPNVTGESTTPQAGDFITDNINNVTGANEIVSYTVSPVAEGTGCPGSDFTINITINSEPVGLADASTVCAGVSVGYDLQNNVNTLGNSMTSNFSWVAAANANVTGESTTPQVGAIINDVLTNTTGVDETVTYTVTPTDNTNSCVGDDFVITVTVQSEPVGAADTETTCSDVALAYDLQNNVNTLGNSMASNFTWVAAANANVTGESTTPQAGAIINDVLTNTTGADETVTYTVTPTETTNSCAGNDFIITVTVQSEPEGAADAATTCSDVALAYNLQNNVNTLGNSMATNFSWVAIANANVTGESTTPQAGATINDVLTNTTGADEMVTYTVTPTDNINGCVGNDFVITITVESEPVGVAEATAVCSDVALAYDLQNNVNTLGNSMASNFSWVAAANANVTGESTTPQAGAIISDVLTNTTGADETVTYTVTPTDNANGCLGNDFDITVIVQSEPVGAADVATTCSDVALAYDLQNNVNTLGNSMASNFSWVATANANVTGESTTPQAGATINDVLTNTTGADETVTYTITPTDNVNSCVGNDFVITVTVQSEPRGANDVVTECSDIALSYDLQANVNSPSGNSMDSDFSWIAADNPNVTGESLVAQAGDVINDVVVNTSATDQTVVYTVTPTETTNGCVGNDFTITVTIEPEPLGVAEAISTCSDIALTYDLQNNVNALGNGRAANFSWMATANANVTGESTTPQAGATINDVLTNTTGADETVTYTVTPTDNVNGCVGDDFIITVTVQSEPVGAADVAITCSDVALAYDLQNNINTLGNSMASNFSWVATPNANVIGESTSPQAGAAINDVLTNTTGADETVTYTVTPTDNTNACVGDDFVITVTVQSEPVGVAEATSVCSDVALTYDLQNNVNMLGNNMGSNFSWVAVDNPNVTGESLVAQAGATINDVLTNTTGADETVTYTVTPTDNTNGCVGDDFVITVTVQSEPVGAADVVTTCSDVALTYDLQNNINTLGNSMASNFSWVATPNANVTGESTTPQAGATINDVLINTTGADETVTYTVTPTDNTNACVGDDFVVTVTVQSEPVGVADAAVTCSDVALAYDLQNNVNTLGNSMASNFSWVAAANANVTGESTTPQAGAIINDVLTNTTGADETVTYTVTPTETTNGCVGNDFVITITVQSEPRGVNDVVSECSDVALAYDLQANVNSPSGNSMDSDFSWIAADNPNVTGESLVAQPGDIINDVITNTSTTDQTVIYTVTPTETTNGCVGNDFTVTVTVRAEPLGVDDAKSICSNSTTLYDLQNNINTLGNNRTSNFSWAAADNPNVTGESTTPQALTVINDLLRNFTNVDQDVVYTVTPTGINGCVGNPFDITITVQPEPLGVDDTDVSCSDVALTYDLQNNINSLGNSVSSDFTWTAASNPSVTGESTTPQAGDIINDVITNTTGVDQIVTYTVTPTDDTNGCVGADFTVDITVNSEPRGQNDTEEVCSDVALTYDLQNNVNSLGNGMASNFIWIAADNPNVTGESTTPQGGSTIIDAITNTTGADELVVYTVTPTDGTNGCVGDDFTVTVTVHSEPVGVADVATTCSDVALTYDLQNNVNTLGNSMASTFSWVATPNASVTGESTTPQAGSIINDVITNQTSVDQTVTYTVTPTDAADNCVGNPFTITVTVQSEPTASNDTYTECSDIAIAYDLQNNVDVFGNGMTSNFDWIATDNPNVTGESLVIQSSGTISDVLTNNSGVDQVVNYTVTPTETANGCVGDDFVISVTVLSEPLGVNDTDDECSDVALSYNLQNNINSLGNGMAASFSWVATPNANVTGESTTPQTGAIISDVITNISGADEVVTYTATPTATSNTCVGDPFTIDITIHSEPVGANDTDSYCSDVAIAYDLQNNVNTFGNSMPSTFTWVAANNAFVIGESTTIQSGSVINDVITNQTASSQNVVYTVTPTESGDLCVGNNFTITVTIDPEPVMNPALATANICSNSANNPSTTGIVLQNNGSSVVPTDYDVSLVSQDAGLTGTPTTGTGLADNAIQNDSYVNVTSIPLDVVYQIIPNNGVCPGDPFNITVTVDPMPVVNPSLDAVGCSDDDTGIVLSTNGTSVAAGSYRLDNVTIPVGLTADAGNAVIGATGGTNLIQGDSYTNQTNASIFVTYDIIPISVGPLACEGETETFQFEVLPEPVFDSSISPAPVCSDTPLGVMLGVEPTSVAADSYDIIAVNPDAGLTPVVTTTGNGLAANAIVNDRYINVNSTFRDVRYTVRPVTAGCEGDNFILTVRINPAPDLADLDAIVCSNEVSGISLGTTGASAPASDYRIVTVTPDPGLTVVFQTADNTTTSDVNEIAADQYINNTNGPLDVLYEIVPISGAGCEGPQETVTLTVEPEPTMTIPPNENICNEDLTSITLNSATVPTAGNVTFDVQALPVGAVTGAPFLRQNLSNGFIIEDELRNLGTTVAEIQYTITPKIVGAKNGIGCTSGTPTVVSVFVEPEPSGTFNQSFVTICEGESLDDLDNFITTTKTPSGAGILEYELTNVFASDPAVTGYSATGLVLNTSAPSNELTDIINIADGIGITSNQTVTYQFTPRIVGSDAGTCVGAAESIELIVSVRPRAEVTPSETNVELCSGESREILLPTDVDNSIATWTVVDNPNVDGEFSGLGSRLFLSLINNSTTPQTLEYVVTPISLFDPACSGPQQSVFVTVNPIPDVVVADTEIQRCDGDMAGIELNGTIPNSRFEWTATVLAGSVNFGAPGASGSGTNGDMINHTVTNTGTTQAIIRYEINAFFDKTLGTGLTECEGFIPGFVTMTVSPPVSASIVPDPDVGTGTRYRCVGDAEGIRFNFTGAPPFTLTLNKTDANGNTVVETLENLPSQHVILAQETVSYDIVQIEDVNGCIATSTDQVDVVFEDALADFEVRGADAINTFAFTKSPPITNLDFDSGTATIEFRINNYIAQNTYVMQVGDSTFEAPGAIFQYTFTEPSPQGTLGFTLEMQVETPNAFNCNDVENYFIQVEPASPVVIGCIGDDCNRANSPDNLRKEIEGCPPLNVDFNSYIEDENGPFLSRNIQVENLQWDFGDGTGNTANAANTSYTFTRPGSYQVTVTGTNGYGEFASDQLTVIVYDQPTAIVQSNQEVVYIPDDPFKPINRSVGADRFEWDFGDNTGIETGPSPQHFYDLPGEYTVILEAFNDENCSDTTSVTVNVEEGGFTKTPNAFTPSLNGPSGGVATGGSGSALNDVFLPITQGVEEFRMIIFDRWGNLVFESNDKNIGWDGYNSKGKLLPAGVYVYKLELTLSNGQRSTRVGDVTLIR
ncbi:MAG: PKD-like domain-containing protein [Fulvivirga sp.]